MTTNLQKNDNGKLERLDDKPKVATVAPAVDIYEGPDETWVVADLPGVKKEDLHVEVEHDELRLRARARGFHDGDVEIELARAFRVPPGIEADKVTADLRDGVLTLKLPKPSELKPRRIEIA